MTFRIHDYVLRGEIRDHEANRVSGWLEALTPANDRSPAPGSGKPTRVFLSLTGNLTGQLRGRTFRFQVRDINVPDPRPVLQEGFSLQQIGVIGDSQLRIARTPMIPVEEFCRARERGEAAPEELLPVLYLEWYSQNGRMVLELVNPRLEYAGSYHHPADPEPEPLPDHPANGLNIIRFENNDDAGMTEITILPDDEPGNDPYQLFPDDLESVLNESIRRPDEQHEVNVSSSAADDTNAGVRTEDEAPPGHSEVRQEQTPDVAVPPETIDAGFPLRDWAEILPGIDPETRAMYEEWDEVTYGTRDEPLTWLFEEPLRLPQPDDITDEDHAWQILTLLLSAMALRGVAFDMCPHFTAHRAYALLINELLPEATAHPNLVRTGFVQHYGSWEHCPDCQAEFDAEYDSLHPDG